MGKYNYTDLLRFANTAAGKFVAVVVAVVMVLSLSSIALAVDGALENISENQAAQQDENSGQTNEATGSESETATEGEAPAGNEAQNAPQNETTEGAQNNINTEEATPVNGAETGENAGAGTSTGESAGAGATNEGGGANESNTGEGAGENENTPGSGSSDTSAEENNKGTSEGAGEGAGEGTGGGSGEGTGESPGEATGGGSGESAGEGTSEGSTEDPAPQTTEEAIQEAITNEDPATEGEDPIQVNEASIHFEVQNASVQVVGGQNIKTSGFVKWPLQTALQFTVVPNTGNKVERVHLYIPDSYPPATEDIIPDANGVYTIPANCVTSAYSVEVVASGGGNIENPDPVEEESEVVADGTYDAPVITVPSTLTYQYNGLPQPGEEGINFIQANVTGLQKGDRLVLTGFVGTCPTNVKESGAVITVTDYAIFRGDSELFTSKYKPAKWKNKTIKINITKAPLTIVTPSASKEYDGTPLTFSDGAELATLWNTYGLDEDDFVITGTQTNVGSSLNTYKLSTKFRNRVKDNYYFVEKLGRLTVKGASDVAIIAPTDSKIYDGLPLAPDEIIYVGLPDGYSATAKVIGGPITNAGTVRTRIDKSSVKIFDESGKDATKNFTDIEFIDGELQITPLDIYVLTLSETKDYDGTPLRAGGEMAGLIEGETAEFVITGSQTEVGSSPNTYQIVWNGTAKQANYNVVEELGTLRVNPSSASAGGNTGGGNGGGTNNSGTNNSGTPTYEAPVVAPVYNAAPTFTPGTALISGENATAASTPEEDSSSINPAIETVATSLQNAEQIMKGEDPTPLAAPAVEETLDDDETPLGVFDEPIDCWVHWYSILGIIATAVYAGVVMFFRRAYAYELETREANVLGVPVGLAQPSAPVSGGSQAGRRA